MSDRLSRAPGRTREFWLNHIEQWKRSALSKAAYCQQNDLSAGNFYNWSSKESSSADAHGRNNSTKALKLIPVAVSDNVTNPTTVSIESNGLMFRFPPNLSADDIERWLTAIKHQRA